MFSVAALAVATLFLGLTYGAQQRKGYTGGADKTTKGRQHTTSQPPPSTLTLVTTLASSSERRVDALWHVRAAARLHLHGRGESLGVSCWCGCALPLAAQSHDLKRSPCRSAHTLAPKSCCPGSCGARCSAPATPPQCGSRQCSAGCGTGAMP